MPLKNYNSIRDTISLRKTVAVLRNQWKKFLMLAKNGLLA